MPGPPLLTALPIHRRGRNLSHQVICFAEEMWSSLFRTVWSVLDRTPKALLVEIILVNDASTADWLQADLTQYLAGMPPVVKMVMAPNRSGLIRARTIGAQQAHGDVIVFLDSHCEAADGWYVPAPAAAFGWKNAVPSATHATQASSARRSVRPV